MSTNLVFIEHVTYRRTRFLLFLVIFNDLLMKTLLLSDLPVYNVSHLLAVRSYQAFHCFSVDKRNSSRLRDNVIVLFLCYSVQIVLVVVFFLRR